MQEEKTEAYTAPPQMRTLPVNTQGMASLKPDNAMNAKQGKKAKNGTGRRLLTAVGIVCVILAFFAVGFTYYYMMNEEEGEEVSEQKPEESSESETAEFAEESSESIPEETAERAELTPEELMVRYAEYMELNPGDFRYVNSYKLVCINDDDLPECLMTCVNEGVSALMYYNKETDSCVFVSLYSGYGTMGGTKVEYAEKENVFCVVEEIGSSLYNAFYQFAQGGSVEVAGGSSSIVSDGRVKLTIGSGVNARTDVSKAEYDEYNNDFGELTESVSYDGMYLTLDKAYEKYLAE